MDWCWFWQVACVQLNIIPICDVNYIYHSLKTLALVKSYLMFILKQSRKLRQNKILLSSVIASFESVFGKCQHSQRQRVATYIHDWSIHMYMLDFDPRSILCALPIYCSYGLNKPASHSGIWHMKWKCQCAQSFLPLDLYSFPKNALYISLCLCESACRT